MPPSEQKPLTNAALARHWQVSPPYVTKLRRPASDGGKGMPDFATLAEADAWRQINAPPKIGSATSSDSPKNIADSFTNTTGGEESGGGAPGGRAGLPANNTSAAAPFSLSTDSSRDPSAAEARKKAAAALGKRDAHQPREKIDVAKFIHVGADFEALMIEQAEEVPQVARGLFMLACEGGNPAEISAANRNWHESAKSAYAVRSDYVALQERTRALISIDDVRDVLGTELQAGRAAFLKLGERVAAAANPENPLVAKAAIDAAVDEIFRQLDAALERAAVQLSAPPPA